MKIAHSQRDTVRDRYYYIWDDHGTFDHGS